MIIYGDSISGNCLKVKWVCDHLGLPYEWVETDILKGESRTEAFLAMNPFGQVPVIKLNDGRCLAQSNAILLYLAGDSALVPGDSFSAARMMEWLFWEQYSHEPYVAVARFQVRYLGRDPAELDQRLVERAKLALRHIDASLEKSGEGFLTGNEVSLADVSLVAYSRLAPEGGLALEPYPQLTRWISRVEDALSIH